MASHSTFTNLIYKYYIACNFLNYLNLIFFWKVEGIKTWITEINNKYKNTYLKKVINFNDLNNISSRESTECQIIINQIQKIIKEIIKEMKKIPTSVEKTKIFAQYLIKDCETSEDPYDLLISFKELITKKYIAKVKKSWVKEIKEIKGNFFGGFRDGEEILNRIIYYRFNENCLENKFDQNFVTLKNNIAQLLLENYDGNQINNDVKNQRWIYETEFAKLFDLILLSRTNSLVIKNQEFIELFLERYSLVQHPKGYWFEFNGTRKKACAFQTIILSTLLLKLSSNKILRAKGIKAAEWLLKKQSQKGFWYKTDWNNNKERNQRKPSIILTIFALEAILRSGIPYNKDLFDKTIMWIISQQDYKGTWDDHLLPNYYTVTAIVYDFLCNYKKLPSSLDNFQQIARDFIKKAEYFSNINDNNLLNLSYLLAHQALEMFIYCCIQKKEGENAIYRKNNRTIGLKEGDKKIKALFNASSSYKDFFQSPNTLTDFIKLRDEFIHRSGAVERKKIKPYIEIVRKYISYYSELIFKCDILL